MLAAHFARSRLHVPGSAVETDSESVPFRVAKATGWASAERIRSKTLAADSQAVTTQSI